MSEVPCGSKGDIAAAFGHVRLINDVLTPPGTEAANITTLQTQITHLS
jgi:hypothetical protein